jgi:hypothetical protein
MKRRPADGRIQIDEAENAKVRERRCMAPCEVEDDIEDLASIQFSTYLLL